ncbi:MAG: HAD family hydrolase [Proteobacteria bacterium]|nr:HAD family hydrolase [Pseudomonadota bacterium]
MSVSDLWWLPENPQWSDEVRALGGAAGWDRFVSLANCRMDFLRTERLDKLARKNFGEHAPTGLALPAVRLAILGSSMVSHLIPAIRVAFMRRGMWAEIYTNPFGQYLQDLMDPASALHAFKPNAILFAFDARHALGKANAGRDAAASDRAVEDAADHCAHVWNMARQDFACPIIQQTILPLFPALLGSNEHRLPGSPQAMTRRINQRIRERADEAGVDILALDTRAMEDGLGNWHDPVLWHRAKIEIAPPMAPLYGDLVARIVAAQRGRSYKCLVLDLDNTLWGGVIGDDGIEGIVLGQGSSEGEAFIAFQDYAQRLSERGIILAVCSKNDETIALTPFARHPDMVLKRSSFAAFIANWSDKATNLRAIAAEINIGLDALVFADDNPFERNLVRRELPMVAVPELPEDAAFYAKCIADGGYFESVRMTGEDFSRAGQYQANAEREFARQATADLPAYLKSLEMEMRVTPFDSVGQARITQLINKTNQFNLTTRRYAERDVEAAMADKDTVTFQIRLTDKYGDNGMIAVVIAKPSSRPGELMIDTWLMSCRVLGRQVEQATLNLLVGEASKRGYRALVGEFRPTEKNGLVRDHYAKLGFEQDGANDAGGSFWRLPVETYIPVDTHIKIGEN